MFVGGTFGSKKVSVNLKFHHNMQARWMTHDEKGQMDNETPHHSNCIEIADKKIDCHHQHVDVSNVT